MALGDDGLDAGVPEHLTRGRGADLVCGEDDVVDSGPPTVTPEAAPVYVDISVRPEGDYGWLPLQQVVYRQLLYLVTIQSVVTAIVVTCGAVGEEGAAIGKRDALRLGRGSVPAGDLHS